MLVSVTDCASRPLGHILDDSAFSLSENGIPLSSSRADRMIVPARRLTAERTLIALDLSGSIVRSGLKSAMLDNARAIIDHLAADHRVAIFGFDGRPDLVPFEFFTSDPPSLDDALTRAGAEPLVDDSTNLNGAVLNALQVLDRGVEEDARDIYTVAHGSLLTFTDGPDLAGRVSDQDVAKAVLATPHSTFAIGVGSDVDQATLARIGATAQFPVSDVKGVTDAFQAVSTDLIARSQKAYVVSYCTPARAGLRSIDLVVSDGRLTGSTKLVFTADGFGGGCDPANTTLR
jgi:hypothetical protein